MRVRFVKPEPRGPLREDVALGIRQMYRPISGPRRPGAMFPELDEGLRTTQR